MDSLIFFWVKDYALGFYWDDFIFCGEGDEFFCVG